YGHASGRCSVTGGYRYRGPVVDARGKYFYADYCTGEVWTSTQSGSTWSPPGTPFQDLTSTTPAFGEDEQGNLYTLSGSVLLKLTGVTGPQDGIFQNGFE
ncbi:MAG TPA: hypothetical protein VFL14_06105, partial [Xanthomonadales bacterium]|nr:hypothetical protein [Xanthomonadales bacterium]